MILGFLTVWGHHKHPCVGSTNPFIIGDKAYEGNWFYDFVKRHEGRVWCYQLNTGGMGEVIENQPNGAKVF